MSAKKMLRNRGVDALRILAMFFVVVIHVLGKGGVQDAPQLSQAGHTVAWLLRAVTYCAVNCYAMISGFVLYTEEETPYRYYRYAGIWLQVFVYCFGISLIALAFRPDNFGFVDLVKSALPVTTDQYWYFTAYTGLFFVIPWLNRFLRFLSRKAASRLVLVMFLLFSCYETLAASFGMDRGMNFLWLVVMYIFGAWVKKCGIADLVNSKTAWLVFILSCVFSWLFKILSPVRGDLLICYTSPSVVLAALMLLLLFSKWEMGDKAWSAVRYISPATFGVYILHMQPFIKENVLKDAFSAFAALPWFLLPFAVLAVAAGIFILCVLIEKIRVFLFEYLKINAFTEKYAQKAEAFLRKHLAGILNHIP